MTRHSRPDPAEFDEEPRQGPRIVDMAPWLVVGCGVGVMIFLFVAVIAGLPGTRPGAADNQAGFSPAWPFDPDPGRFTPAGPTVGFEPSPTAEVSIPASGEPARTPARRTPPAPVTRPPRSQPAAPTSQPAAPPPERSDVTGRYRVMSSYHDSFLGEVLVINRGRTDRQWTVELRFPENVGRLRTAWVESAPQATLRRSADRYIFTSTAPVAAGSSVPLRFHFDRSGRGETPSECRANGTRCTIS